MYLVLSGNSILIEGLEEAYEKRCGCRNDPVFYEQVSFTPETSTVIRLQTVCQELIGSLKKNSAMCERSEYECREYSNFFGSHLDVTKTMLTDLMIDAIARIQ